MKSHKFIQMPPYLRAAYVSKYLPVKWDEEKVYAPVTELVVKTWQKYLITFYEECGKSSWAVLLKDSAVSQH